MHPESPREIFKNMYMYFPSLLPLKIQPSVYHFSNVSLYFFYFYISLTVKEIHAQCGWFRKYIKKKERRGNLIISSLKANLVNILVCFLYFFSSVVFDGCFCILCTISHFYFSLRSILQHHLKHFSSIILKFVYSFVLDVNCLVSSEV